MKTAIITGVTGQDGSYLASLLLRKGYKVIGLKRRTSLLNTDRVDLCLNHDNFVLRYWSLFDPTSTYRIMSEYMPDEWYNLAAMSHVKVSFETPIEAMQGILIGTGHVLEAIRTINPSCKFYQASSSEMYGRNKEVPLSEKSIMLPCSPYACAKLAAHHLVQNYRASYGIHASSGILFNHESPRRGETFVTRKITRAAARIKKNMQEELVLGNLDAERDWGHAEDYVYGMWLMTQQSEPDDYVLATGEKHTVREFVNVVFNHAGMPLTWKGREEEEVASFNGVQIVRIDSKYYRPQEVGILLGDSSKAQRELQWKFKFSFKTLAKTMYDHDLELIMQGEHK